MSRHVRHGLTVRSVSVIALATLASASMSATGTAADDGDLRVAARVTTTIDAATDPQAAADAINEYCSDREKCLWNNDAAITTDFGPNRILGDVLYNCSVDDDVEAETAVGVSDERGQSTSLEESLSLEASLAILGLAETSAEFKAYSKQASYVGSEVTSTKAVGVPAGYKGWTESSVRSAILNGTVTPTQGIDLQVSNVDLSMAGYLAAGSSAGTAMVFYSGHAQPMTAQEISDNCPTTARWAVARPGSAERLITPGTERFQITVCRDAGVPGVHARRCIRRKVSGRQAPPHREHVRARLTRAGVTYAVERNRRGGVELVLRRTIRPGHYMLVMRERSERFVVRRNGKKHHAVQRWYVHVPLKIGWRMSK